MKKYIQLILRFIFRVRYRSSEFYYFKMAIISFYDNYSAEFHYNMFRITKCRLYNYPKGIVIEIYSLSPGMIIGPKGKHMDDFKTHMQKRYSKPVKIILEETNPFK